MRYSSLIVAFLCLPWTVFAADYSDWKAPPPLEMPSPRVDVPVPGPYVWVGNTGKKTYQLSREQMQRHNIRPGQRVELNRLFQIIEEKP